MKNYFDVLLVLTSSLHSLTEICKYFGAEFTPKYMFTQHLISAQKKIELSEHESII